MSPNHSIHDFRPRPHSRRKLGRAGFERLPAIIGRAGEVAAGRFVEFFAATIRNRNTRAAYAQAVGQFFAWCEKHGIHTLEHGMPVVVAAYIEQHPGSPPTVKQHLAAIRMLFDFLVTGQVVPVNPAASVRGPKHVVKKGKTSVLSAEEMRALLDSINVDELIGLRDRALIALMGYTFARVGAAVRMKVEDYYVQNRRGWVRLHEKGGKVNELPCHHNLEQYLDAWLAASGLAAEPSSPLFPTFRNGKLAGRTAIPQHNVYAMIQRRAKAAGIATKLSCHSFRATGITTYLQNGGKLEVAQQMAGHESARTTGLYDRGRSEARVFFGGPRIPSGPAFSSQLTLWASPMKDNKWPRLLTYVTGLVNQEFFLPNEYLAAENQILRAHLPARLRLSDPERSTLAEIGKRLGRKALAEVARAAKPDTTLAWYRRLIANKSSICVRRRAVME